MIAVERFYAVTCPLQISPLSCNFKKHSFLGYAFGVQLLPWTSLYRDSWRTLRTSLFQCTKLDVIGNIRFAELCTACLQISLCLCTKYDVYDVSLCLCTNCGFVRLQEKESGSKPSWGHEYSKKNHDYDDLYRAFICNLLDYSSYNADIWLLDHTVTW